MSSTGQTPPPRIGSKTSGPQGTRLFSTESLRQYASDAGFSADGPASIHEPVLEGVSPGLEKLRFPLHPGRMTIGRGADNDIVINDPSVSASHGWLIIQPGHYLIMNTLSTNGTYVNDQRIHEATLKHGDHIRLGQAELLFLTREGKPRWLRLRRLALGLLVLGAAWLAWRWW
ncbi:MAG: FHA domain-containing protein [Pseudomonadota bacterium]|jgi:hypothetical protein|nr:FHA domain-containing protein [Xanthomonadaceae bacterium]MDE2248745.1 FHA domain-containing protein [Xanthomonadaceae bacterium]MDE3210881.1 FHA domain-containing protein [Pseudomonadota bacterium]